MVVALASFGLKQDTCRMLSSAVGWLKKQTRDAEWYLRVPALLAVGERAWVEVHGDREALFDALRSGAVGEMFFRVALTASLIEHGYDPPRKGELREMILERARDEAGGLLSFDGITSTTALYATYLDKVGDAGDKEKISKAFKWLIVRRIEARNHDAVCWENSFGRTAYVVIDMLHAKVPDLTNDLVLRSLAYFKPSTSGEIPGDKVAAFQSKSAVYTTILFLRLWGAIIISIPSLSSDVFAAVIEAGLHPTRWAVLRLLSRAKTFVPLVLCIVVLIAIAWWRKDVALGTVSSLIATVIAAMYLAARRIVPG